MTRTEIATRLAEIAAEMKTNEDHAAAIREQVTQLIEDLNKLEQ